MIRILAAAALLASLAACNTVNGIGRDLSAGGAAISGAADHVQHPRPVQQQPYYY